ncbi:hypothetical protein [Paenibacillus monticola]|uniref:Uncharacterized protein n=1 Tax=Paenibacillus monticola TaxID=2666075 RepID=A0A7X2H1F7_9BACL|nr:hypothetical protein [Paenibacillus monticola]MRN51811.1 hypothetical protein [Paenibacillus monticola]
MSRHEVGAVFMVLIAFNYAAAYPSDCVNRHCIAIHVLRPFPSCTRA